MTKVTPFTKTRVTPVTKLEQLQSDTDYLFCPVCRIHVPCRRMDPGGWEVQCPGCVGECAFCGCYLRRFCFGSREQFPPFDLRKDQSLKEK